MTGSKEKSNEPDGPPGNDDGYAEDKGWHPFRWCIKKYAEKTKNIRQNFCKKDRDAYEYAGLAINVIGMLAVVMYTSLTFYQMVLTGEGVELSRKAFVGQQRPWVTFENVTPSLGSQEIGYLPITFKVSLKNLGQTPATNVTSSEYKFYPIIGKNGGDVIEAKMRSLVKAECANGANRIPRADYKSGKVLFQGVSKDIDVPGKNVVSDDVLRGIDEMVARGDYPPIREAIVVFHVAYQSSIDNAVHCTAQAHRIFGKDGVPFCTLQDITSARQYCISFPLEVEIKEASIDDGYAD